MSYNILYTPEFSKEIKRLLKKYPSFKKDFSLLLQSLQQHPLQGFSLGNNFYKIRLAISGKMSGKSGGARIISFVKIIDEEIILISLYDKSLKETLSDKEIKERLNKFKRSRG